MPDGQLTILEITRVKRLNRATDEFDAAVDAARRADADPPDTVTITPRIERAIAQMQSAALALAPLYDDASA